MSSAWQDRLLRRLVSHEHQRGPAPHEGLPSLPARFRIVREIARGGWGIVLEAEDSVLARRVALKILTPDRVGRAGGRFVNEAQVAARLEHPAIVPIYDLGHDAGGAWLCMRLVQGEPLAELLQRLAKGDALAAEAWPLERLVDAVLRVAEAVDYAHSQGVIHRDIKPGNVLTGRFGEVFLADFGLAKYLGERPQQAIELTATRAGVMLGTPGFMPPEQADGKPDLDGRVDVYALGALLYNVLTLTPPEFHTDDVVPAEQAAPPGREVPPGLAAVARRCMQADPARRYPDVASLVADLRAWREGRPLSVWSESWSRRAAQRLARNPTWSAAVVAALVVSAVFGGVLVAQSAERARHLNAARADLREAVATARERAQRCATLQAELAASWGPLTDPHPLSPDDAQRRAELATAIAELELQLERARAHGQRVRDDAPADAEARALVQELDLLHVAAHLERERALEDAGFPEVRSSDAERLRTARRLLAGLAKQELAPEHAGRYAELARAVAGKGALQVEVTPAGTPARLLRVVEGEQGVLREEPLGELARTPLEVAELERGSYVLQLGEDPVVRVPFLLERNEVEAIRFALPREIPRGLAYVPAGSPLLGGESGRLRKAEVGPFLAATHEVTLGAWRRFLAATGAPLEHFPAMGGQTLLTETLDPVVFRGYPLADELPVCGITPAAAAAYCAWRSRLDGVDYVVPSEDEWEYAARGADGRPYPWGERYLAERCNTALTTNKLPYEPWWSAVGRFDGDLSPFGLYDCGGNVTEITRTTYGVGTARDSIVIKGGAFSAKQGKFVTTWFRQAISPGEQSPSVGMRLFARPR